MPVETRHAGRDTACRVCTRGCANARMPGCPDARMPECPDARMPGCPDARMPGMPRMPECPDARMPECPNARNAPNARMPGCPNARMPGCPNARNAPDARLTVRLASRSRMRRCANARRGFLCRAEAGRRRGDFLLKINYSKIYWGRLLGWIKDSSLGCSGGLSRP